MREAFGLDDAPVLDMADLIERRVGCDVAIEAMPAGADGVVGTDPYDGLTIIAVATSDMWHRRSASLWRTSWRP